MQLTSSEGGEVLLPRLNGDIFAHMLEFADRSDLLTMMKTCQLLQDLAIVPLLKYHGIFMEINSANLGSFLAWMHRDSPRRYLLLRILDLSELEPLLGPLHIDDDLKHALVSFLKRLVNLETLMLFSSSRIFRACPDVMDAIASLTRLRSLTIWEPWERVSDFLQRLQSPLSELSVQEGYKFYGVRPPVHLLAENLSGCVEHLSLYGYRGVCSNSDVQFVKVTSLCLTDNHSDDLHTANLAWIFPNLTSLTLRTNVLTFSAYDNDRRANISAQKQPNSRWHHLNFLSGHVVICYVLAPRCQITSLALESPVNLFLRWNRNGDFILPLLPSVVTDNLRHLELELWYDAETKKIGDRISPEHFCTVMRPFSNLTFLRFTIMRHDNSSSTDAYLAWNSEVQESVFSTLSETLTSVCHFVLELGGPEFTTIWRSAPPRAGSKAVVEQLSPQQGQTVLLEGDKLFRHLRQGSNHLYHVVIH
ncbi:unnamed protein product [Somion occarium]|uniref:F-box domain-containing protein n=1 Tax=Somion occarium TaxID=3059160 RepID=A0ABP1E995_9APHY